MAKKRVARRAAHGLAKVSVADMQRELRRRQTLATRLERKKTALLARVAALEIQIRDCGGSPNGSLEGRDLRAGIPREGRPNTLAGALASMLKGKTMRVVDMSDAVQRAGYATRSPNFRTIVNATVTKHADLFKRVGRGQYTAR